MSRRNFGLGATRRPPRATIIKPEPLPRTLSAYALKRDASIRDELSGDAEKMRRADITLPKLKFMGGDE